MSTPINPDYLILTPLNLGGGNEPISYSDAITATILQNIAGAGPTSSTSDSTPMTQAQQNTFWMLRATNDLTELYNQFTQGGTNSQTVQNLLTDLGTVQNYVDPTMQSYIKQALGDFNGSDPGTFLNQWNGSLGVAVYTNLVTPSSTYDFSSLSLGEQMSLYTIMLSGLKLAANGTNAQKVGEIVQNFWGGPNGQGSIFAAHFQQTLTLYYYSQSLNPDGTLNQNEFVDNLNGFYNQFNLICSSAYNCTPFTFNNLNKAPNTTGLPAFLLPLFNGVTITAGDVTAQVGVSFNTAFANFNIDNLNKYLTGVLGLDSVPTAANIDPLPVDGGGTNPLPSGGTQPTLYNPPSDPYTNYLNLHIWPVFYNNLINEP